MLIIPVFVPHEGCPHACCFCNQRKISGQNSAPSQDAVRRIIESYLDIIPNYDAVQVAFFGGSFTGIPEAVRRQYLETAASYVKNKQIDSIRISTRRAAGRTTSCCRGTTSTAASAARFWFVNPKRRARLKPRPIAVPNVPAAVQIVWEGNVHAARKSVL